MGLCCQLLCDLVLQANKACQSTFLSLDIKTFDNHSATDAEEGGEEKKEKQPCMLCLLIVLPEMSLCHQTKLHDI